MGQSLHSYLRVLCTCDYITVHVQKSQIRQPNFLLEVLKLVPLADFFACQGSLVLNKSLHELTLTGDCHGQVHVLVNSAIEMESPSRIEGTDLMRVIAAKALIDRRRTSFFCRFGGPGDPRTVGNDVRYRLAVYQREHRAFRYGDGRLKKSRESHLYRCITSAAIATMWRAIGNWTAAGPGAGRQQNTA